MDPGFIYVNLVNNMLTDTLNCYRISYPLTQDYKQINKLQSLFGFAGVFNRLICAIINVSTSRAERAFLFVMKICSINGCNKKHNSRGFCKMHYQRFLTHGDPLYEWDKPYNFKHGLRNSPEYNVWAKMKSRCISLNKKDYSYYSGRGIKVCKKWKKSFKSFYDDMGPRPSKYHQIDRIDNDGNYEPGNCRWVTPKEQAQNRSITKLNPKIVKEIRSIYVSGIKVLEIANIYHVCINTIWNVIKKKSWSNL